MKEPKPKCVYVEWYDHASDHGWVHSKELSLEPLICKTVGWVVKEDKRVMILGSTMQHNMMPDNSGVRTHILKGSIRKKRVLK